MISSRLSATKCHGGIATKWRHDVATGASPWSERASRTSPAKRRNVVAIDASPWCERSARTPATKWRHDVATGASPWNIDQTHTRSPEGTTGTTAPRVPFAPSGLVAVFRHSLHGLTPVATPYRPFGTDRRPTPAAKRRNAVPMGASPWMFRAPAKRSPEGTAGTTAPGIPFAPSGLSIVDRHGIHGLTPVATLCRPFGTMRVSHSSSRVLKTAGSDPRQHAKAGLCLAGGGGMGRWEAIARALAIAGVSKP